MYTHTEEQLSRARALVSYVQVTGRRLYSHKLVAQLNICVDYDRWMETSIAASVGTTIMGAEVSGKGDGVSGAIMAAFEECAIMTGDCGEFPQQKHTEFLMWMNKCSCSDQYRRLAQSDDRTKSVAYLSTAIGFWVLYQATNGDEEALQGIAEKQYNELGAFYWNAFRRWWVA